MFEALMSLDGHKLIHFDPKLTEKLLNKHYMSEEIKQPEEVKLPVTGSQLTLEEQQALLEIPTPIKKKLLFD